MIAVYKLTDELIDNIVKKHWIAQAFTNEKDYRNFILTDNFVYLENEFGVIKGYAYLDYRKFDDEINDLYYVVPCEARLYDTEVEISTENNGWGEVSYEPLVMVESDKALINTFLPRMYDNQVGEDEWEWQVPEYTMNPKDLILFKIKGNIVTSPKEEDTDFIALLLQQGYLKKLESTDKAVYEICEKED